ncbi:MAG: hypothetical protein LQ341_006093 [Variospora aurantia]|nr:MAG: hypothetical protein LQ341_006093 [Variospora aurantia]
MQTPRVDSQKAKCSRDGKKKDEDGGEGSAIWIICRDLPHLVRAEVRTVKPEEGDRIRREDEDGPNLTMLLRRGSINSGHDRGDWEQGGSDEHCPTATVFLNLLVASQDGGEGRAAASKHRDCMLTDDELHRSGRRTSVEVKKFGQHPHLTAPRLAVVGAMSFVLHSVRGQ